MFSSSILANNGVFNVFFKSFTRNVSRDASTNRWQHSIRILSKFSQVQTSVICFRLFHLISVVSKNYFYIGIHSWIFKTQDFVKVFPRTNIPVCNLSPSIPYSLFPRNTFTLAFIHGYLRRRILSKFSQEQTSMACL